MNDDLEPIDLERAPASSTPTAPTQAATAVRDRFLVALAVVVAAALIALAIQIRAIASEQEDETTCARALVATVAQRNPTRELPPEVAECLGEDEDDGGTEARR